MADDEGKEDMVDLLKFKMEGDSNMSKVLESAKEVGQLIGNASIMLEHGDRIKHTGSEYAKTAIAVGGVLGAVLDGLKKSREYHAQKLMLPLEVNAQLKDSIAELTAAKENVELQKKVEALTAEVMKLPTKKLPENIEDLETSIKAKQKELEKDRKKLANIKKSKKS